MNTVDYSRMLRELYTAGRQIAEVDVPRGVFLTIDGQGAPGGAGYVAAIDQLFSVAYTLKYALKAEGLPDFKIGMLECLWFNEDVPRDPGKWRWRAMLRIPVAATPAQVAAARKSVLARKGLDARAVRRTSWREGKSLQVLHVGPYDDVGPTYQALQAQAAERHYRVRGPAHEIYLNDPRRVGPERTRTIVRLPIAHPRPAHARQSA